MTSRPRHAVFWRKTSAPFRRYNNNDIIYKYIIIQQYYYRASATTYVRQETVRREKQCAPRPTRPSSVVHYVLRRPRAKSIPPSSVGRSRVRRRLRLICYYYYCCDAYTCETAVGGEIATTVRPSRFILCGR